MRLLTACLVLAAFLSTGLTGAAAERDALPRFTEEREAAAVFFVKKNLPELLPLLEQLKKNSVAQYQNQIRDIFQVTEMLADLGDEPKRYDLELKIWQTENRAHTLVARLSTPIAEERKKIEEQLQTLAKELVDLDVQVLEQKAEQLDKELGEVNDELTRVKKNSDKMTRDRYDALLEKANRPKK